MLVLVLALATVAGLIAAYAMDRIALPERLRRRVAVALLIGVALVPVAGVAALAASSRGLTGEVSHVFSTLTSTHGGASNTPARLVELGNTRARYWSEGVKVGEHALLKGVGALGYETAVTRYTTDANVVPHAHSFVIETFADFGLIGIAVMLGLLAAWAIAARRTADAPRLRVARRRSAPDLLTMLAVVVTFGAHSAIDWTWFIPGTAVPALVCAGWLAGRGPSARRGPGATPPAAGGLSGTRRRGDRDRRRHAPVRVGDVAAPARRNANTAAITAFAAGNTRAAIGDARTAAARDPLTVDPLFQLAAMYTATGDRQAARDELLDRYAPSAPEPADVAPARRVLPPGASALVRARAAPPGKGSRPRLVRGEPGAVPSAGAGRGRLSPLLFAVRGFGTRVGAGRVSDVAHLQASNSALELGELVELRPVAANELASGTVELGLATEDLEHRLDAGPSARGRWPCRRWRRVLVSLKSTRSSRWSITRCAWRRRSSSHGSALWGSPRRDRASRAPQRTRGPSHDVVDARGPRTTSVSGNHVEYRRRRPPRSSPPHRRAP